MKTTEGASSAHDEIGSDNVATPLAIEAAIGSVTLSEHEMREFYWSWLLQIDNDFSNRSNYFVVAEAMLMAGFGAAYSSGAGILVVFAVAGALMSLIWLYANHMVRSGTERPVKERLAQLHPAWREIQTSRAKFGRFHLLVGWFLPVLFLVVWLLLLILSII